MHAEPLWVIRCCLFFREQVEIEDESSPSEKMDKCNDLNQICELFKFFTSVFSLTSWCLSYNKQKIYKTTCWENTTNNNYTVWIYRQRNNSCDVTYRPDTIMVHININLRRTVCLLAKMNANQTRGFHVLPVQLLKPWQTIAIQIETPSSSVTMQTCKWATRQCEWNRVRQTSPVHLWEVIMSASAAN